MSSKAVEVLVYWEPIAYSEIFVFWKWYPHIGHGSLSCSEFLKPIRHEMHVQNYDDFIQNVSISRWFLEYFTEKGVKL